MLNNTLKLIPYGGSLWWHIHEMLFGFTVAIVTGFLLTAVQNWTQRTSVKGWHLVSLVSVWLVARLLMLWPSVNPWIVAVFDLAYLPLTTFFFIRPVWQAQQWRNVFFAPLLLVMFFLNIAMHVMVFISHYQYLIVVANTMVMMISLFMVIIGGRVFPMFTANGTGTDKVKPLPWLERVAISSVGLSVIATFFATSISAYLLATTYGIAALANAYRVCRWRIWITWNTPLLWSLHLSYWFIVFGLFALALAAFGIGLDISQAIHTITLGAIGGMILSMISRVSLGHTGRIIVADRVMFYSFIVINLAAIVRVVGPEIVPDYISVLLFSVILWSLGFGLYLWKFIPILNQSRSDGRPG